ncbi:hypothetical protein NPIL_363921 [Nephila pilipes]|uniref:Uncharacterized protein n=1 Tax=Nephila pilipes TaxID=299642 RepID=A0A8X6R741_NEPPI|nr:hypothetical protein NPIL_363921 [Nephila pilipes]
MRLLRKYRGVCMFPACFRHRLADPTPGVIEREEITVQLLPLFPITVFDGIGTRVNDSTRASFAAHKIITLTNWFEYECELDKDVPSGLFDLATRLHDQIKVIIKMMLQSCIFEQCMFKDFKNKNYRKSTRKRQQNLK